MIAYHVFVSGHVQGVFFRVTARQTAQRLGVDGWVRNTPDGRVESWVQGEEAAVEAIVSWLFLGPDGAAVTDVDVSPSAPDPALLAGFRILT